MSSRPSVWVLCTGEPLPIDPGRPRLLRAGLLCDRLVGDGFRVDFWASNFDHASKTHRVRSDGLSTYRLSDSYSVHLLPSSGYTSNVSLARIRDHRQLGRAFLFHAGRFPAPNILVVSMPSIDLAYAGARYAVAQGIPFVLDLRDLWPEIFYLDRAFPQKQLVRLLSAPWSRMLNWALKRAASVVGITDDFVTWGCQRSGRVRHPEVDLALPLAYPSARPPTSEETEEQQRLTAAGSLRPDLFQVCFLGAVSPRTDLATFCQAGVAARAMGLPVHLVVAGSGEALADLRAAFPSPNVQFLGRVDQSAILAVLRTSKVGIVPYRTLDFEMSIPNKAIEYLSHGLPIVTCLRGTLARLIDQEGLGSRYPAGDSRALLHCLRAYLDAPNHLVQQSKRAHAVFQRSFSAEVVFEKYARHLLRLMRQA